SFRSAKELQKCIEILPSGPRWKYVVIETEFHTKHILHLFFRDVIACLQVLLSDPVLTDHVEFCPHKIFTSAKRVHQIYHDWLTGDCAWELQTQLPPGSILLDIILSSNKTHITLIGNCQVHPLLISLANISSSSRNKELNNAYLLLALMLIPKFTSSNPLSTGMLADRLLHQVIDLVVEPLKKAAQYGRMMSDPAGNSKYYFTLLTAYIADTPEAHVLTCVRNNASHVTTMMKSQFGDCFRHLSRTAHLTLLQLHAITTSPSTLPAYFKACKPHLNGVNAPFWQDWALTEPSIVFGPEPLHHVHKMFWDHNFCWAINLLGEAELDFRFLLLQPLTGYHWFSDGVTLLRSPSGRDHRNIQQYIIGIVAGAAPRRCITALCALNDFRYYAQAPRFSEEDITRMQNALKEFHDNKSSIIDNGARTHWQIPKLELLKSVTLSIRLQGAPMQWTTDIHN
ncbi:hypothetical protein PAXINDRAFT_85581, partial [Paxillus involutus ATCC 200175]